NIAETRRGWEFCERLILSREPLVVLDAARDERLGCAAIPIGGVNVRFCAAAPLLTPDGETIGALGVVDTPPRASLTADELGTLTDLAGVVMRELDSARRLEELRAVGLGAEGEAKFRALMEAVSQAIVGVDQRGRIEVVNRKAEELFGYTREE